MSRVTNLLMSFNAVEQPSKVDDVNLFFTKSGYERGLISIEDDSLPPRWYGGNKPFEVEVLVGAFNFLEIDRFITYLQSLAWANRDSVQLFVQEQEEAKFRIITL